MVSNKWRSFAESHHVLTEIAIVGLLCGAVAFAVWLLVGSDVGDDDITVDIGFILGALGVLFGLIAAAVNHMGRRRRQR